MPRQPRSKIVIRPAEVDDLEGITSLCRTCTVEAEMKLSRHAFLVSSAGNDSTNILRERFLDRCLLVADQLGCLQAAAGIDLDSGSLGELMIAAEADGEGLFESLIVASERLAVSFGLMHLSLQARRTDAERFGSLGFAPQKDQPVADPDDAARARLSMQRSLRRRQTAYGRRVQTLGHELGIPAGYGRLHRLALQPEAGTLTSIGSDIYGREQKLSPPAAAAWLRLQQSALSDGIELQAVSAWRSVGYQAELLRRKLNRGISMEEILKVSAPPGFSEHHSGRAIDVSTPGFAVLEEAFENSPAFRWLEIHAAKHSFRLSFPRGNRHQLAYEPWHWCYEA